MIIKKFRAEKMEDAKKIAEDSLGPDAIVLSSKPVREKGIKALFSQDAFEVTAAVDEKDLEFFKEAKKKKDPLDESLEDIKRVLGKISSEVEGQDRVSQEGSPDRVSISNQALRQKRQSVQKPFVSEPFVSEPKESIDKLKDILEPLEKTLRQVIQEELAKAQPSSSEMNFLLSKGIDKELASKLQQSLGKFSSKNRKEYFSALKEAMKEQMHCKGPIYLRQDLPSIVATVGARGVGKSSVASCIARQYQAMQKKVVILSFDQKIARAKSEDSFSQECIGNQKQLHEGIDQYADFDLIIIDTLPMNPYQKGSVQKLESMLLGIEDLQPLLVLNANTRQEDLLQSVQAFSLLKIDSLVFTKLEESGSWASLLNTVWKTKIALRFISEGFDDLRVAEAAKIVKELLTRAYT